MRAVEIVGIGFSLKNYFHSGTETWTCNMGHFLHEKLNNHTKTFIMDDFDLFEEKMKGFYEHIIKNGNKENISVYTSRVDPRWGWAKLYPLHTVISYVNADWFNNTLAYMIAYAIASHKMLNTEPVDELHLHGVDYKTEDESRRQERECTSFWLGMAHAHGIKIKVNPASFLLEKNYELIHGIAQPLYGYRYNPPRRKLI